MDCGAGEVPQFLTTFQGTLIDMFCYLLYSIVKSRCFEYLLGDEARCCTKAKEWVKENEHTRRKQ